MLYVGTLLLNFYFSKQQSKFIVNYSELFEGDGIIHKRPIFMLVFDGKNGGAQCRWKLHYVGCIRNEADCPMKFRQEVPKVQGHRAVSYKKVDDNFKSILSVIYV